MKTTYVTREILNTNKLLLTQFRGQTGSNQIKTNIFSVLKERHSISEPTLWILLCQEAFV